MTTQNHIQQAQDKARGAISERFGATSLSPIDAIKFTSLLELTDTLIAQTITDTERRVRGEVALEAKYYWNEHGGNSLLAFIEKLLTPNQLPE